MKTNRISILTAAALLCYSSAAFSQQDADTSDKTEAGVTVKGLPLGQVRPMTVEIAKQLVAAAKKSSCSPPTGTCSGAFAVVDDAGVLVYLEIIEGVLAGGPDLAIKKAKTAALWRRPTEVFQQAVVAQTNTSYADGTFENMTTSRGGIPVFKDGRIVGGFGMAAVGKASSQIGDAVSAEAANILGKQ